MEIPPPTKATASLPIRDLIAYGDAQLDRILEENRRPDGAYHPPIEGWETVGEEERDGLSQRLRLANAVLIAPGPLII